ncbi:hypothetical protein GCM10009577_08050 [Streptomyces javensis]
MSLTRAPTAKNDRPSPSRPNQSLATPCRPPRPEEMGHSVINLGACVAAQPLDGGFAAAAVTGVV